MGSREQRFEFFKQMLNLNEKLYFSIVGGIYTVLRTKAPISTDELGDQYYMMVFERKEKLKIFKWFSGTLCGGAGTPRS
jgi:hypothetical protein